jgi:predicted nucleic acid-binding protein
MIALFDADDRWHERVTEALRPFRGEVVTSAACVIEAAWITSRKAPQALDGLLKWLARGAVRICNIEPTDCRRIADLSQVYRKMDPDFADLALIALAERERIRDIVTVDKRNFDVYRLRGGRMLKNVLA